VKNSPATENVGDNYIRVPSILQTRATRNALNAGFLKRFHDEGISANKVVPILG
jgi:hypothetical protein